MQELGFFLSTEDMGVMPTVLDDPIGGGHKAHTLVNRSKMEYPHYDELDHVGHGIPGTQLVLINPAADASGDWVPYIEDLVSKW